MEDRRADPDFDPKATIVELCRLFYTQGWVSGTGGGISVRHGGRVYLAPSGVQKERMTEADLFELDEAGEVLRAPANPKLRQSGCKPLFYNACRRRDVLILASSLLAWARRDSLLARFGDLVDADPVHEHAG